MRRRGFLAAGLAALAASPASAVSVRVFYDGPLADNRVAQRFFTVPPFVIPTTKLIGDDGPHQFSELTGKVRLVPIWAEWCTPCLIEAGDLAMVQQRYGGANFEVRAILSASAKHLDLAGARKALMKTQAETLPLWVEPKGGDKLARAFGGDSRGPYSLPCLLLVDARGVVRGRSQGVGLVSKTATTEAEARAEAVAAERANTTRGMTEWWTDDGAAFIKAISSGALD